MHNTNLHATCPICKIEFRGNRSREHPNDDGSAIWALANHLDTCGRQCPYCLNWIATVDYESHRTECRRRVTIGIAGTSPSH